MMLERPIRKVEAFVYRYPIAVPVRTSFGTMHDRPAVFVRIEDADGAIGWGEAWCNFPTVGAEHRARVVNELIAPLILERPFASPRDAFDEIDGEDGGAGHPIRRERSGSPGDRGSRHRLVGPCGAARQKPLWSLLGGTDPRLAVYASGINPDRPEKTIGAIRARGHSAFKLKVGFGDELDDRNLRVIREEFGQEIYLAVDANQAWDLKTAIRQGRRFEAYELELDRRAAAGRSPLERMERSKARHQNTLGGRRKPCGLAKFFRRAVTRSAERGPARRRKMGRRLRMRCCRPNDRGGGSHLLPALSWRRNRAFGVGPPSGCDRRERHAGNRR